MESLILSKDYFILSTGKRLQKELPKEKKYVMIKIR